MLHIKYRPETFDQMVGNKEVVKSIKKLLSQPDKPQTFLFTGPSGTGKTTLGRIIGNELTTKGEEHGDIQEINAADFRGVEYARSFVLDLRTRGFFVTLWMYIFDECHQLTTDAQHLLLRVIEEPPRNRYFIFCTTNPEKLIEPFKNRCFWYSLKPVSDEEIRNLLKSVIEKESISITEEKLELIVLASKGIPRDALRELGKARYAETFDEAENLIYRK